MVHGPSSSTRAPSSFFFHQDSLGSTVNLTDASGTPAETYLFDAWGNYRALDVSDPADPAAPPVFVPSPDLGPDGLYSWEHYEENIQLAFAAGGGIETGALGARFTGHEFDPETGLYYFQARFYDPDLGRFASEDPYLGDTNTPPSLHRYLYAYGSPLRYVDLTGYAAGDFWDPQSYDWGVFARKMWEHGKEAAESFGEKTWDIVADTYRQVADVPRQLQEEARWQKKLLAGSAGEQGQALRQMGAEWEESNPVKAVSQLVENVNTAAWALGTAEGRANLARTYREIGSGEFVRRSASALAEGTVPLLTAEVAGKLPVVGVRSARAIRGARRLASLEKGAVTPAHVILEEGRAFPIGGKALGRSESTILEESYMVGDPFPGGGFAGQGPGASSPIDPGLIPPKATRAIQHGDVTTLQDFVDRSIVGDDIEGHELWQHANIRQHGLAEGRLSTLVSQQNPIVALKRDIHQQINTTQRMFNAKFQSPLQNIESNAQILRDLKIVKESTIDRLEQWAKEHAKKWGF